MANGKINILKASLELYNEYGVANVSQQRISRYLNISPGNLTYHFKKKDSVYEHLYFEFVKKITKKVNTFLLSDRDLSRFADLIDGWFSDMHEYRFIFIDLTYLIRNNDKIRDNYVQLVETRRSVFLKIIDELIEKKSIVKTQFEYQYKLLYDRLHIVSDFYLSSIVAQNDNKRFGYLEHKKLFFSALYPVLTKKGRVEYNEIFNIENS